MGISSFARSIIMIVAAIAKCFEIFYQSVNRHSVSLFLFEGENVLNG